MQPANDVRTSLTKKFFRTKFQIIKEHYKYMSKINLKGTFVLSLLIVLTTCIPAVFAQDESKRIDAAAIPTSGEVVDDFIPEGWKIENDVAGDLNNDGTPDHAITLIEDKPETDKDGSSVDRNRGLVIVFGQMGGKLTKSAVADRLLQCPNCGGAFYGCRECSGKCFD